MSQEMRAEARNTEPAAVDGTSATVGRASLIATYYGPRETEANYGPREAEAKRAQEFNELQKLLFQHVPDEPGPNRSSRDKRPWKRGRAQDIDIGLYCFDPAAAHDTTVIQMGLNAEGAIADAWKRMRCWLVTALKESLETKLKDSAWGYTLIYQAVLTPDPDINADQALDALLPFVQRLHGPTSEAMQPVAHADMAGGRVWLLAIPMYDEGAPASVYVALSTPDQEKTFVKEVLFGSKAALLMPDLIAHKGYFEMRQYREGQLQTRYELSINDLQVKTDTVLQKLESKDQINDLLEDLKSTRELLRHTSRLLNRLRITLRQQIHNYDQWRERMEAWERMGANAIFEFHRGNLQSGAVELDLLMEQGREGLQDARDAVDLAQVQMEKVTQDNLAKGEKDLENRQQHIQRLIGLVGAVLAVPSLIGRDVARALLRWCGIPLHNGDLQVLLLVGIQLLFILFFAAVVWLTIGRMAPPPNAQGSPTSVPQSTPDPQRHI